MIPRSLATAGLALFMAAALGARAAESPGLVQVRGTQFVLPSGSPLLLKGINLGNWLLPEGYMFNLDDDLGPWQIDQVIRELVGDFRAAEFWERWRQNYITREDIRLIRNSGFNSVRIPFDWRLFVEQRPPYRMEGPGWSVMANVIGWCHEEGVYAILDMHAAPGGQTGMNIDDSYGRPFLFDDPAAQELTIRLWTEIARRFAGENAVLGYNLLNEPMADFFDEKAYFPRLEPFFRRVIAGIRTVDPGHIIILGGARWDKDIDTLHPPHGPNVAYTFHLYDKPAAMASLKPYLDFRSRYGVPVWLGESGEADNSWIRAFRELLEANSVGWCFWPYKKMEATTCVASVPEPAGWKAVSAFSVAVRTHYADMRKGAPPQAQAQAALDELLANVRLEKCRINGEYLRALGLAQPPGR